MIPMIVSAIRLQFFAKFHIQDADPKERDCDNDENEVSHKHRKNIPARVVVNDNKRIHYLFAI